MSCVSSLLFVSGMPLFAQEPGVESESIAETSFIDQENNNISEDESEENGSEASEGWESDAQLDSDIMPESERPLEETESVETENAVETEESPVPESAIDESEINSSEETVETPVLEDENNKVANSWRFHNGVWNGSNGIMPFSNETEAWTKVNGQYINTRGEVVPGAVARGIDVSEFQGKIDWNKVIQDDISFAIVRCGASLTHDDAAWEYNVSECERLGLPYGVYFYSYANDPEEARKEAEHCLRLLQGHDPDYPVYLDLEDDWIRYQDGDRTKPQRSSKEIADVAKIFVDMVSAAGYKVSIYANTDWWTYVLTDSYFDQFASTRWVAQYNYRCTYSGSYIMWQCSCTGSIDGINTAVDLNLMMGEMPSSGDETYENGLHVIDGVQYYYENGIAVTNQWREIGSDWYWFGEDGSRCLGWTEIDGKIRYVADYGAVINNFIFENGKWYYFDGDGVSQRHKWLAFDNGETWCWFDDTGARCFGWTEIDGKIRYVGDKGAIINNFIFENGKWYYFDEDGVSQRHKWLAFDNGETWCWFDDTGARCFGWTEIDGKIRYVGDKGAIINNFIFEKGKWYYFDEDGVSLRNTWMMYDDVCVYFDSTGARCFGATKIGNQWYYITADGPTNTTLKIDGKTYSFDVNGKLK